MALNDEPADRAEREVQSGSKQEMVTRMSRKPPTSIGDPIGAALRRLHDEVAAEPLSDDFLNLIAEIDRKIESEGKL